MTSARQGTNAFRGTQAVTTSYYGLGGDTQIIQHVHGMWDAALVATITFWTSEFDEVALNSTTAGEWVQEDPPSANVYLAISPAGACTSTNMTITIPGGVAGGFSLHLGNLGSLKLRARVICTTAGFLRLTAGGKE